MYGPELAPRPLRQTSFSSRVLHVPPGEAVQAFDTWLAQAAGSRLELDLASAQRSDVGPWREVRGVLRSAHGRVLARVALELGPWSPSASELGLRLLQTPRATSRRYFAAAHDALDSCAAQLLTDLAAAA